jgi:hypothetical protein
MIAHRKTERARSTICVAVLTTDEARRIAVNMARLPGAAREGRDGLICAPNVRTAAANPDLDTSL